MLSAGAYQSLPSVMRTDKIIFRAIAESNSPISDGIRGTSVRLKTASDRRHFAILSSDRGWTNFGDERRDQNVVGVHNL